MCISKAGLSSLRDDWAKYKNKRPDVSDSNQNVETTCNPKCKLTGLKEDFKELTGLCKTVAFQWKKSLQSSD